MVIVTANVFCLENATGGNPCAIVDNFEQLSVEAMQQIAKRLDLPETVFIFHENDEYILRFFATKGELPLCCHATLGAVFFLTKEKHSKPFPLRTYSGIKIGTERTNTMASMSVAKGRILEKSVNMVEIGKMLNMDDGDIDKTLPCVIASIGSPKLLVPIRNRKTLFEINPNNALIMEWCRDNEINGLYVYSSDTIDGNADYVARNFNPLFSDNEDVATGVAAATLCQALHLMANQPTGTCVIEQGYNLKRPSKIQVFLSADDIRIAGRVNLVDQKRYP